MRGRVSARRFREMFWARPHAEKRGYSLAPSVHNHGWCVETYGKNRIIGRSNGGNNNAIYNTNADARLYSDCRSGRLWPGGRDVFLLSQKEKRRTVCHSGSAVSRLCSSRSCSKQLVYLPFTKMPFWKLLTSNFWLYGLVGGFMAGLFEETGRFYRL